MPRMDAYEHDGDENEDDEALPCTVQQTVRLSETGIR